MIRIFLAMLLLFLSAKMLAQDSIFFQNVEWSPDETKICTEVITVSGNNFSFDGYIINLTSLQIERK